MSFPLAVSKGSRTWTESVHDYGIADDWCQYRDEALREIAIAWCEEHGIRYTETSFTARGRAIIMITVMFHATAKPDKVEDVHALVITAAEATRAEEEGCLTFVVVGPKYWNALFP